MLKAYDNNKWITGGSPQFSQQSIVVGDQRPTLCLIRQLIKPRHVPTLIIYPSSYIIEQLVKTRHMSVPALIMYLLLDIIGAIG